MYCIFQPRRPHTAAGAHLGARADVLSNLSPVLSVHLHALQQQQRLLVAPVLGALLRRRKDPWAPSSPRQHPSILLCPAAASGEAAPRGKKKEACSSTATALAQSRMKRAHRRRSGSIELDEVPRRAARRESALCVGLWAQINVWQLCAVVAESCAVHPGHRIAEVARLHVTAPCQHAVMCGSAGVFPPLMGRS